MNRLIAVVLLAGALSACASGEGKFRIFDRGGRDAPSFETVMDFIRLDDERGARLWLAKKNVADADADELIIRARVRVQQLRDECEGKTDCAL